MPALNWRTHVWTTGLVSCPFLWRPGAAPSEEASHLLVSFRSPGPLLCLLSGPIRTLTGGSQPVKSHLSAVRTGLETPYTLQQNLQHTLPSTSLHFTPNVNVVLL
uniref:Secreted protein n=1 Tax=Knipowitschia caucasica TaxID=637954 RepID=A0AAV2K9J8_KNICA